jgi:hypothetical protein
MDGQAPIHTAGQPLLLIFTDFRTLDTHVDRLISVANKSHTKLTQSVVGRPRVGPASRPLGPFDLWFGPMWSTCHKHSCGDTTSGGIPNVLVVS